MHRASLACIDCIDISISMCKVVGKYSITMEKDEMYLIVNDGDAVFHQTKCASLLKFCIQLLQSLLLIVLGLVFAMFYNNILLKGKFVNQMFMGQSLFELSLFE